jgi:hypothetical protein
MPEMSDKVKLERKQAYYASMVIGVLVLGLVTAFAMTFKERRQISEAYVANLEARKCVVETREGRAAKVYRCALPAAGQLVTAAQMYQDARALAAQHAPAIVAAHP